MVDRWRDGGIHVDRQIGRQIDGWMDRYRLTRWMDGWIDLIDGWIRLNRYYIFILSYQKIYTNCSPNAWDIITPYNKTCRPFSVSAFTALI